ncbi:ArsR/SmtB family transcription factor [Catellatospora coxensis]|uniref:ArsR/SmtB family transcription factor n=1 Tax=Catellatospora coxensis TaxID=310354 RepID=UPI001EF374C0|nr:metalloregulator ArsR/SmtB family transcription factor [Catellatospora coxensis]
MDVTEAPQQFSPAVRAFLKALASESRQQVLMAFAAGGELSVGDVAARLGIGQSTASEQLAQLRDGGLLAARREGKAVYYRADPVGISASLAELQDHLRSCCPI